MGRKKVIIMGAAGRDFHNFNVYFRGNDEYEVVAFTATQIPGIEGRTYPPELAGPNYPNGIPIYPEEELPSLIKKFNVDEVVFAYSDVPYEYVMHKSSEVNAAGADFRRGREGRDEFGESIAPEKPDKITLGTSLLFRARDAGHPVKFDPPAWAYEFPTC
ncbi:MAG: hypothetical protein ACP6IT_07695, partial [Candidatus Thorarchaeota archaeon]